MAKNNNNGKIINSQAAMNKAIKSICDILRRDKAKGARLYVPELTWMFFLRYLDLMELQEEQRRKAIGTPFKATLGAPYRWRDWGAPFDIKVPYEQAMEQKLPGWKRRELSEQPMGAYLSFINDDLFPYLKALGRKPGATNKQKVIAEIISNKEKTILASETNIQNALDKIHEGFCPAWEKRKMMGGNSSPRVR
jgi:type I restriction enzyme M protein